MKLNEGESYSFLVLKTVEIPHEGEYFLLRHQSGRRILLPVAPYQNYGIATGSNIECIVDKVSCTGKVYLEPKHPVYEVGSDYFFEVVGLCSHEEGGATINQLVVRDVFGNEVKVVCDCKGILPEEKLNLRVGRIRKGLPQLVCPGEFSFNHLKSIIGGKVDFLVAELLEYEGKDSYFMLKSSLGHTARLKHKHFKNYGFKIGSIINCLVYDYDALGELKVEPNNPNYKVDEVYDFEVDRISVGEGISTEDATITVIDLHGNRCGIQIDSGMAMDLKNKTRLTCRVLGFRKGRPKLTLERK